jgi:sterol desaturase/sphingolipid hydroxylase (fatty acid hydroxylase superfamily)
MSEKYQYQERQVEPMPNKEFGVGTGRTSGYASFFLGFLSLLGVLAFLYPEYLTTAELREVYDAQVLQNVLKYGMYFSLFFGLVTFFLRKRRLMGFAGIALTGVAFALGGYSVPIGDVADKPLALGVDWLILAFLLSTVIFTTLEKLFPKYKEQIILRKEWQLDFFYFCINHLLISAVILVGNYVASVFDFAVSDNLRETVQSLPLAVQVIMVLLIADFILYWEHRMFHESSKLWRIHAVHHSVETMDWLAGSRGHVVQVFVERTLVIVPLYLIGPDKAALDIYVTFAALQAIVIHCNVGIPFGPLKYIFVTPQFHHWHHSSEQPAIDTNYAAHTTLFDRLFGTYHFPGKHWPAHYGTTVRLPRDYIGQMKYPFSRDREQAKDVSS